MNKKIKVLWFCNIGFSECGSRTTGSWLYSMAEGLLETGNIELFNITEANVKETRSENHKSINQWLVPRCSLRNGLPRFKIIQDIQTIIEDVKPDIIHIWGTENYWGLLYSRGFIKGKVILEIQGLKYAYAKYFYYGLTITDIFSCFRLKELLKPTSFLVGHKIGFQKWAKFENEMLSKSKFISTQSNWVRVYVKNINNRAKLFETQIPLRKEFLVANKWDSGQIIPFQIFTSLSSPISYKGLHILIDAVAILKTDFPNIKLNIACTVSKGIRKDGYTKWLQEKIRKNKIFDNVEWLGSLDAISIIQQMHKSNVVVVPSFIETYCLALAEALTVGVPTVVSFSGAMPELAVHENTALFYPPGDVEMCADAIKRFFIEMELSIRIGENAYRNNHKNNNNDIILSQIEIYENIL